MMPAIQPFARDRLTWLAYAMLAYIGFSQSILGPLMPFLRTELELNFTLGGLLPATLATGLIVSGLISDGLARRWSRGAVFWLGAVGLAGGVVLLTLSYRFESALIAVLGMGTCSSLTQVMIQALLSDRHTERRAIALTEANVAASLSTTVTPLVIGGLQSAGLGWRSVPNFILLFLAIIAVLFFRQSIPDRPEGQAPAPDEKRHLPIRFWLYWIVLFFVVAAEMSVVVWATEFLDSVVGLSRTNAVLGYSAFPAAMLVGRIAGSRLTRRSSSLSLLLFALEVTLLGFPLFWLAPLPALNILGLFITGLGIANLYPLTLSVAIGVAQDQSNLASARISMAVGTALLTAPLLLGWLADRLGLHLAYGMTVVLMVAALAVVISSRRVSASQIPSQPYGKIE